MDETYESGPDEIFVKSQLTLPERGTYSDLIGPDGSVTKSYCYDHHEYGYFNKRFYAGGEFGPEAMDFLVSHVRHRLAKNFDAIIMVTGEERSGKSTFALQLARAIDPEFPAENVCFKIKEFNERIAQAVEGDVIIFDESGFDLFSQEWWADFQIELVKKLQVIGKKRLVLILVLPHRQDLNRKIRERRVKFWVHVYTQGENLTRGFCEVCRAEGNKWYQTVFWNPLICFRFKDLQGEFRDRYEAKKDAFIDEVQKQEYEPENGRNSKLLLSRDSLVGYILDKKLASQRDVAGAIGITQAGVSKIYDRYKTRKVMKQDPSPK